MDKNRIHIYLKLYDFEIHPDEVTRLLNLEPTEIGIKGDKFFIGSKKKKIEREYSFNFWEYKESIQSDDHWHQKIVDDFVDRIILPRKDEIGKVTENGRGELLLVSYYYNESNFGYDFSLDIMATLIDAGVFINMDTYSFLNKDESQDPETNSR